MLRNFALAAIASLALATPAICDTITNVDFDPDSPATLPFGQHVDFTFDYDVPQDALIFGRPMFEGALQIAYAAHPSPVYSMGTGSGGGFLTILDVGQGFAFVDEVRFQIFSTDQTVLLDEILVPVDFTFGTVPVPEPGSLSLLGAALAGVAARRRLRRRAVR